jgi:hypothetical protein
MLSQEKSIKRYPKTPQSIILQSLNIVYYEIKVEFPKINNPIMLILNNI